MPVTDDPDLHLLVDGTVVRPSMVAGTAHVFRLELPATEVRLVSRSARPADVSRSDDTRLLGFAVSGLRLQQGQFTFDIQLSEPELVDGFHDFEPEGWRWTNGNAGLPHAAFATPRGAFLLIVFGWGSPSYRVSDEGRSADERLMLGFESLGDDCEFGFVQRHHEAEPMGLLRWANIGVATLQTCLEQGFEGLGDIDNTDLVWSEGEMEYKLVDRTSFSAHTWVTQRVDQVGEAKIKRYGCMQLRLLRRKLMTDIEHAKKIFVFKSAEPGFGRIQQQQLHRALQRIGPSSLLCVQLAGPGDVVGQVEERGDGLFVGYIDAFVLAVGPYETWRSLCVQTTALEASRRHANPALVNSRAA